MRRALLGAPFLLRVFELNWLDLESKTMFKTFFIQQEQSKNLCLGIFLLFKFPLGSFILSRVLFLSKIY